MTSQEAFLAGHCPVTGRYFEPCRLFNFSCVFFYFLLPLPQRLQGNLGEFRDVPRRKVIWHTGHKGEEDATWVARAKYCDGSLRILVSLAAVVRVGEERGGLILNLKLFYIFKKIIA